MTDDLARMYRRTEAALPAGWRLEGLRCASTGLAMDQRSDEWHAVAHGPNGGELIGRGIEPAAALADLAARIAQEPITVERRDTDD